MTRSSHLQLTLATVLLCSLACADDGAQGTDAGRGDTGVELADTGVELADTGVELADASASDAEGRGGNAGVDAGAAECPALCARAVACGVSSSIDECSSSCDAAPVEQRRCLAACDSADCTALLACFTACGQPGNPDALPYGRCSAGCRPGVTVCIASSSSGGPEHSVCAPFCDEDGACPAADSDAARARCDEETVPSVCRIDCGPGGECPEGMVCDWGLCTWTL